MDKKYTIVRCVDCSGAGIIKRKQRFSCKNCKKNGTLVCFLCEHVSFRGLYEECGKCYGNGEIYTSKDTNTRVLCPI